MISTNKKKKFNLVNTNPTASEWLTSKCNLELAKIGLTNTEVSQILCQLFRNMKVPLKRTKVVIKKPDFFKLFPGNAEKIKPTQILNIQEC